MDGEYPFQFLSGAGVALKLMIALSQEFFSKEESFQYLSETIDIAAL
jgi:single-stranded DNA-specific DHH superfamily exonuclease